MGRPVILSNGAIAVGLDEKGLVHDFYYPYIGQDNLTSARKTQHLVGVWVDGEFSWTDSNDWNVHVDFEDNALVSTVYMSNPTLGVELLFKDFVDSDVNAFCRTLRVKNKSQQTREIRIFMHQVFEISQRGRNDTAMFVPDGNYILDYKGRCSLLIYGEYADTNEPFKTYSIGNYGIEGKEGTFRDAEDGELSMNNVEHGGVDSVMGFTLNVGAGDDQAINYWVAAADSEFKARKIHSFLLRDGINKRRQVTRSVWKKWLSGAEDKLGHIESDYRKLARKSLMVIKSHIDKRGGIIASCDSSIYNYGRDYYSYVWPRDGAYVIWPLIRLGYTSEAKKFFNFCRDVLTDSGYMMHKYQSDKSVGSTWHPLIHNNRRELAIQEDESAIIIFMLYEYLEHTGDDEFVQELYTTLISPIANFLAAFIDETTSLPHASYDLWEEKFGTHTYTVALVHRALRQASELADKYFYPDDTLHWQNAAERISQNVGVLINPDGDYLRKSLKLKPNHELEFDNTLDVSSLHGALTFNLPLSNIKVLENTADAIEQRLLRKSDSGGIPRYEYDSYFAISDGHLGNPWAVTTLWYAQYLISANKVPEARQMLDWVKSTAAPSGALAEQFHPETNEPISVMPLVWSHAEFINTALDLAIHEDSK